MYVIELDVSLVYVVSLGQSELHTNKTLSPLQKSIKQKGRKNSEVFTDIPTKSYTFTSAVFIFQKPEVPQVKLNIKI